MFKLSNRSLEKLEGVNPVLVETVKEAIKLSSVDFGVIYGVRSLEEQKKVYESKRGRVFSCATRGRGVKLKLEARRHAPHTSASSD